MEKYYIHSIIIFEKRQLIRETFQVEVLGSGDWLLDSGGVYLDNPDLEVLFFFCLCKYNLFHPVVLLNKSQTTKPESS